MSEAFSGHRHQVFSRGFYRDDDFDYTVRCVLGAAPTGGSDIGEVLATIDGVPDGDHQKWFDAWSATGRRLRELADAERAAGRTVSASSSYLRAATYLSVAVDAASALADDRQLLPTFGLHRSSWDGFVDTSGLSVERVGIPYQTDSLPGYLFSPAGREARPTLIMVNGSDGAISSLWHSGGAGALARGYNVLMFDGPGQQSMLFERGVGFRPDWGPVLTPVVDFVLAQDGVDPVRIAVYGISQAGYWVADALTVEHRLAAAVLDPGVVDVAASWLVHIPASLKKLFDGGKRDAFDRDMALGTKFSAAEARTWAFRARPYGKPGYFDTLSEVCRYALSDEDATRIRTPLLITSPEHEQFWPGQSAALAAKVSAPVELAEFTAAQGADFHCQPLARQLTEAKMFGWLETTLAG